MTTNTINVQKGYIPKNLKDGAAPVYYVKEDQAYKSLKLHQRIIESIRRDINNKDNLEDVFFHYPETKDPNSALETISSSKLEDLVDHMQVNDLIIAIASPPEENTSDKTDKYIQFKFKPIFAYYVGGVKSIQIKDSLTVLYGQCKPMFKDLVYLYDINMDATSCIALDGSNWLQTKVDMSLLQQCYIQNNPQDINIYSMLTNLMPEVVAKA